MNETWQPILGFEDRYAVSNLGRIKSLPFMQRYLLRNGEEAYRKTSERIVKARPINSGYLVVKLCRDNASMGKLVHRLVAIAFVDGYDVGREVNHKDGNKLNNEADNLEWTTRSGNLRHAVAAGLNKQAVPAAGYPSIAQAAKGLRKAHRTIRKQLKAA